MYVDITTVPFIGEWQMTHFSYLFKTINIYTVFLIPDCFLLCDKKFTKLKP